jgi:hypothetical protein
MSTNLTSKGRVMIPKKLRDTLIPPAVAGILRSCQRLTCNKEGIMAYNRNHARSLCTAAEFQLFAASLADSIRSLTPAQLKARLERARRLRDKYRDLHQRQRLVARARTGSKKGSAERTKVKAQLFDEAVKRFTAQSRANAAADKRAAARAKKKITKKPAAPRPAAKQSARAGKGPATKSGFVSEKALRANRRKHLQKTRSKAIQGHVRAAGKRRQARKDTRR